MTTCAGILLCFIGTSGSHLTICTVCGALRVYALWDKSVLFSLLTLILGAVQIVVEFVSERVFSFVFSMY